MQYNWILESALSRKAFERVDDCGKPFEIIYDLKGPKIGVWNLLFKAQHNNKQTKQAEQEVKPPSWSNRNSNSTSSHRN